jgi:epoxyqueuosine reductase
MMEKLKDNNQSRRQFLKSAALAGSALCFFPGNFFSSTPSNRLYGNAGASFEFKYRTLSVEHLKEVAGWIEKLKKENRVSTNETYRSYIAGFRYDVENMLSGAKSLIIGSVAQNLVSVTFHNKGKAYQIITPSGYFPCPPNGPEIRKKVIDEIIKDSSKKIEGVGGVLPVKTIAVRSGLAEYGKNNITFIDGGFGSFHRLVCYATDKVLADNWGPLRMMPLCKGCSICMKSCPTKCIREENFVIEIGNCITLYNERPEPMPKWMDPKVHHTLAGCLKCQDICPANAEAKKRITKLPDITDKETDLILNGKKDKALEHSIITKMGGYFENAEQIPTMAQNLKLALNNAVPKK